MEIYLGPESFGLIIGEHFVSLDNFKRAEAVRDQAREQGLTVVRLYGEREGRHVTTVSE